MRKLLPITNGRDLLPLVILDVKVALMTNEHDYWAKPGRAEQARRSIELMREHAVRFVASLEPVAEAFVNQGTPPNDSVPITPPPNFRQFGFERPDLAVYAVLDAQVKAISNGAGYLGVVSLANYEPYELQGRSLAIARGDVADARHPGEYAPVALAMPTALVGNFLVTWLHRLPQ